MSKITKKSVYNALYTCKLKDIDKQLSTFIKHKKLLSKNSTTPPDEFEY